MSSVRSPSAIGSGPQVGANAAENSNADGGSQLAACDTVKLHGQSYEEIREKCLRTGSLFEDPFFPATASSISDSPEREYEWKRPGELVDDPEFYVDGASRFDVDQGELGNCWFVAAVSSLSQFSDLFDKVVLPTDSKTFDKSKGYTGVFRFHFWVFGNWTEIVVDDRLPTFQDQLVFVHSSQENEFWSSLLEKAYAKLHGSYENLRGGSASDAMEDFTGGVIEVFDVQKTNHDHLFRVMSKAHERHSLMGCSVNIPHAQTEDKLANGLILGHAYSITGTAMLDVKGSPVELLRVRNPWGNEDEWNGAWSDKSPEWDLLSKADREAMEVTFSADGEFWISIEDFMKNFTTVEICHLGPDCDRIKAAKKRWEMTVERGSWKKHVNAGGCLNYKERFSQGVIDCYIGKTAPRLFCDLLTIADYLTDMIPETFFTNPQFRVTVTDADEGENTGTIIVAVLQRRKPVQAQLMDLGYAIYKLKDPNCGPLDAKFFLYNSAAAKFPTFCNRREACARHKVAPGHYCIIPSTFEPGVEGDFLLRVFTEKPVISSELDEGTALLKAEVPKDPVPSKPYDDVDKALHEAFVKIAGVESEINAAKLTEVLNAAFAKVSQYGGFTLDTCRSLVALTDFDHSGKLGFKEFKELWVEMRTWKNEFERADEDKSGYLDSYELRSSIRNVGISVSNSILQALVQRFSDENGKIYFNDYIHCIAKLSTMFRVFKQRSNGTSEAKFNLDDFLATTMYS